MSPETKLNSPSASPSPIEGKPVDGIPQNLSFLQAMKAVSWSFVGLRSSGGTKLDMSRVHPVHIVIAALLSLGMMITALVFLVRFVLG
jgi:Protein of unknown function (DUF2970)